MAPSPDRYWWEVVAMLWAAYFLVGHTVYEAISMGHPERMGIVHGWSVERFLGKSTATVPSGRVHRNLCLGCDALHREVLASATGETKRS